MCQSEILNASEGSCGKPVFQMKTDAHRWGSQKHQKEKTTGAQRIILKNTTFSLLVYEGGKMWIS